MIRTVKVGPFAVADLGYSEAVSAAADLAIDPADVRQLIASIEYVVENLARLVPSEGKPHFDPSGDRPFEQIRKADIEATRAATGWSPRIVLEDGLADTARWHLHQRSSIVRAP